MAITWGTAVGAGHSGGQMRLGYEFSQAPAIVLPETTSVVVTLDIWIWTKYSAFDQYNTFRVTGNFASSAAVSFTNTSDSAWSVSNQKKIRTLTRTITPAVTPTISTFTATLKGIEAVGIEYTATVSGYLTTATAEASPAAPTIINPWQPFTPTAATLRISWTHNPLDGTAQTAADIVYTIDGAETTYNLSGATNYYDIPIETGVATDVITAKVRTEGDYATPGEYSALQSTTLAETPTVAITAPATDETVITDLPMTVAWTFTDEFAQAAWALELYQGEVLLGSWDGDTESSVELTNIFPANGESFSLALTARSGSGFLASTTRAFTTSYSAPTAPSLAATFDPATLSCDIAGTAGATGGNPATDHLVLVRVDSYDGLEVVEILADPFTGGVVYTDYTPPLDQSVTYRLMAVADTGAYSIDEATVTTLSGGACTINFGEDYTELLTFAAGPDGITPTHVPSDDSEIFAFAERPLPVVYEGEHTFETISLSATLFDATNAAAVRALKEWRRASIYREPNGFRARVKATVDYRDGLGAGDVEVSATMQVVE